MENNDGAKYDGFNVNMDTLSFNNFNSGGNVVDVDNDMDMDANDIDGDADRRLWYGCCPRCEKMNSDYAWCNICDRETLVGGFNTWSTGNRELDLFIQETQQTAERYEDYLEYIPCDRFTNISPLEGGLDDEFTAIWLDGERVAMEDSCVKSRSSPITVSLKVVGDSTKTDDDFIKELKLHYRFRSHKTDIYGITQDHKTMNYALVLKSNDAKRDPYYSYCPQCKKANHQWTWCNTCDQKALIDKFNTWSTGNRDLDLFIQHTQRTAECYELNNEGDMSYLEYIPHDRFSDVKSLARGGFSDVYTAEWLDGKRGAKWSEGGDEYIKGRSSPFTVALKLINNSAKMGQSFVNELKLHYQFYQRSSDFYPCYGITQDPVTKNYALIMKHYPDGNLRDNLINDLSNKLTWKTKLGQLKDICSNLRNIHTSDYIHRDIHSGNVLISGEYCAYLTDFGLTQPADSQRFKMGNYGVVPYMAPELFRGESHSRASDIYAFGIIMSEYASNEPAFYDRSHDTYLQREIIDGLRPEVPPETPECYKELMNRCLSDNPQVRPAVDELYGLFTRWNDLSQSSDASADKQFILADAQRKPKRPKQKHPGAIYTSRLVTYVTSHIAPEAIGHCNPPFRSAARELSLEMINGLQLNSRSVGKRRIESLSGEWDMFASESNKKHRPNEYIGGGSWE